ncbi:MAG: hypothetical protein COY40_03450 [Alphaproteobacteria bacterium CG_4_10_14_0_8_um_filter_53_9]|nr:MAG: hypothetical protein COY40_03450 [Alphaproteobacteria bacterium CG_4_10_14_0_8_um_filter_53_9]
MDNIPTLLELIAQRKKENSKPGSRNDPYKLALVAEDGSQRWVVAGGFGAALEAMNILPDLIVGTSGGGIGAIYMATGSVARGCTTVRYLNHAGYHRDGKLPKLITPTNLMRRKPIMDVHSLVHTVFSHKVPIDWDALRVSPVQVFLTATHREKEDTILQPLNSVPETIQKEALINTARIPMVAHSIMDKNVMWDGMLSAPIPVQEALSLGATHIIVIRCKGAHAKGENLSWVENIINTILKYRAPDLHQRMRGRHKKRAEAKTITKEMETEGRALTLQLPHVAIGPAEMREDRLFRTMAAAYQHVPKVLGESPLPWPSEWTDLVEEHL